MADSIRRICGFLLLCIALSGCQHTPDRVVAEARNDSAKLDLERCRPRDLENLQALLWMQTSAEFYALVQQTYATAQVMLDQALRDKSWTAAMEQSGQPVGFQDKPPAVIMDIDETILDNSPFEVEAMKTGVDADWTTQLSRLWGRWVNRASENALPGAVDFIRYAQSQGVHVFLVTNRSCPTDGRFCPRKPITQRTLARVGVKVELQDLLFSGEQGWTDEKSSRRAKLAQDYRIVMLFGDDFGDFLPEVRDPEKFDIPKRRAMAANHAEFWGSRWFMLPNPSYGSWVSMLGKNKCAWLEDFAKHEAKGS